VRNSNRGETIQRIATSARIAEPAFQEWLQFKNERELCASYPTPVRRTRRKSMSRQIVQDVETGKPTLRQRGYVYQKGKKKDDSWNPQERAYGRYRIDVPGKHGQKEVRVALGYCRDEIDAVLKLRNEMHNAGVLDLAKVRERASPAATFRGQATWWIEEMVDGHIVHAKKGEPIDPNTINSYRNAVTYLNELIGDIPLASIDNPQAKTLIAKMKSERGKDDERRFSEKTIVEYWCSARSSLRRWMGISIPFITGAGILRPSACRASIPGSSAVPPSPRRK